MIPTFEQLTKLTNILAYLACVRYPRLWSQQEDLTQEAYFVYIWCAEKYNGSSKFETFYTNVFNRFVRNYICNLAVSKKKRAVIVDLIEAENVANYDNPEFYAIINTILDEEEKETVEAILDGRRRTRRQYYMTDKIRAKFLDYMRKTNDLSM